MTLLVGEFCDVELVRQMQHQSHEALHVRLHSHPRLGRQPPACSRDPIVLHVRQVHTRSHQAELPLPRWPYFELPRVLQFKVGTSRYVAAGFRLLWFVCRDQ